MLYTLYTGKSYSMQATTGEDSMTSSATDDVDSLDANSYADIPDIPDILSNHNSDNTPLANEQALHNLNILPPPPPPPPLLLSQQGRC